MNYIELTVEFKTIYPWRDVVFSILDEAGFESFVETKTGLQSYMQVKDYNADILKQLNEIDEVLSVEVKEIEDQNWNAAWESNFDPVWVDDLLVIKAPFHKVDAGGRMEILIQPKMSFGTGHHQTTWLISKRLFSLNLKGKRMLDMGTGTGVLAILAEKLGADSVFAPDIDQWSYENALENVEMNACNQIEVALGGAELIPGKTFDIILANINRNVLFEQFSVYSESLISEGKLLISGFFETDRDDLVRKAGEYGFIFEEIFTKEGWALLEFKLA